MIAAMDITDAGPRLRKLNDALAELAEIERLRLTDAERMAIADAADRYAQYTPESAETAATLRGLLERHFPASENPPAQDNRPPASEKLPSGNDTPQTHSNQSEASVRPECAISPAWLARPFWVDPASGWEYGFPKLYDPAKDGDLTNWMVANGYPKCLADQNLPCRFTAKTEH